MVSKIQDNSIKLVEFKMKKFKTIYDPEMSVIEVDIEDSKFETEVYSNRGLGIFFDTFEEAVAHLFEGVRRTMAYGQGIVDFQKKQLDFLENKFGKTKKNKMTTKELREALAAYPDDMLVVVSGYEEGFNESFRVRPIDLVRNHNGEDDNSYGRHAEAGSSYGVPANGNLRAVCLDRDSEE